MSIAIIADTGPLYAALDPDDQYHRRALTELGRIARTRREVIVAYPTLLEAYTLALYRLGARVARRWLGELRAGVSLINPTIEDYRAAVVILAKFADQAISLFDATVAVLTERLRLTVWTYDHHFDLMRIKVWRD